MKRGPNIVEKFESILLRDCTGFDYEVFKTFKRRRPVGWVSPTLIGQWVFGYGLESNLTSKGKMRSKAVEERQQRIVDSLENLWHHNLIHRRPQLDGPLDSPEMKRHFPGPDAYAVMVPGPKFTDGDVEGAPAGARGSHFSD